MMTTFAEQTTCKSYREQVREAECRILLRALYATGCSRKDAAARLGMTREGVSRAIRRLGLKAKPETIHDELRSFRAVP